jgi:hypothetical protein
MPHHSRLPGYGQGPRKADAPLEDDKLWQGKRRDSWDKSHVRFLIPEANVRISTHRLLPFPRRIVKYSGGIDNACSASHRHARCGCSGGMKERSLQNGQRLDETLQQSHGRTALQSLNAGASALAWLAEERAEDVFSTGLVLSSAQGRILTSGVGKAGIASGIAELFAASGSPAYFLPGR